MPQFLWDFQGAFTNLGLVFDQKELKMPYFINYNGRRESVASVRPLDPL